MEPEFAPQTTQLKDALRVLRYTLRKGRDTVRESAPIRLPPPASGLALSALNEIEMLARNVDHFVCNVAHTVLGASPTSTVNLRNIITSKQAEHDFSVTYYETMKFILRRLGAKRALVNQSAGRRAFARFTPSQDVFNLAAQLTLRLANDGSVIIDQLDEHSPVLQTTVTVIAVFAAMVYMLADTDGADADVMISAATDLAVAHQERISDLYQHRDAKALASLLERCAAHV